MEDMRNIHRFIRKQQKYTCYILDKTINGKQNHSTMAQNMYEILV